MSAYLIHAESADFLCLSPWITPNTTWTTIDDRVRGGSSHSYLSPIPNSTSIRFYGTLDTSTLGGAGFASQSTTGDKTWDLSKYNGLEVEVAKWDSKRYTITVKDEVPDGKREDGREKAVVSWEYDFKLDRKKPAVRNEESKEKDPKKTETVWIPWENFKATYRGKDVDDPKPLNTSEIRRFGLLMRR